MQTAGVIAAARGYTEILRCVFYYDFQFIVDARIAITAIANNKPDCLLECLRYGIADADKPCVIWQAIANNNLICLRMIIKSMKFELTEHHMHYVILKGYYDCFHLLLCNNCPVGENALAIGMDHGRADMVRSMALRKYKLSVTYANVLLTRQSTDRMFKIVWDCHRSALLPEHIQHMQPLFKMFNDEITRTTSAPITVSKIIMSYT